MYYLLQWSGTRVTPRAQRIEYRQGLPADPGSHLHSLLKATAQRKERERRQETQGHSQENGLGQCAQPRAPRFPVTPLPTPAGSGSSATVHCAVYGVPGDGETMYRCPWDGRASAKGRS